MPYSINNIRLKLKHQYCYYATYIISPIPEIRGHGRLFRDNSLILIFLNSVAKDSTDFWTVPHDFKWVLHKSLLKEVSTVK